VATGVAIIDDGAGRFDDLGLPVHPDRIAGLGAIGGIYTAVETATADRVLVVACDLPFLHVEVLRRLVALSVGRDGAWVCTSRGIEPLLACYHRRAAPSIRAAIEAGRLRASDLATTLDMACLDETELERHGSIDHLLTNVNTPDDYARVQYRPS
jgi:molybdopterin-guanine dinucleotide biosynthesis protein A